MMEKKVDKTKSNKKGTASAKKTSTAKKATTTKKVVKPEVKKDEVKEIKKDTSVKQETIKNEKIPNTKVTESNDDFSGDEIRKLLIIIGAVCAVMLSFYFITEFVIKNKKDKSEENDKPVTEAVIQYEQIVMGELFKQNENDYYVLAFVEDDPMLDVYTNYMKLYSEKEGAAKFYKVNLSDSFNKKYLADEAYVEGSDASKIRVKGTTLIRVKEYAVATSYQDYDAITGKFKRLIG